MSDAIRTPGMTREKLWDFMLDLRKQMGIDHYPIENPKNIK